MSNKAGQMQILREILVENFEAKEAGKRGASTLFEVTSIEGVEIPEEIDDMRFMGNLNIFIMKKKKVLKRVHVSFDGEAFAKKENTYSLKEIIGETAL